LKHIIANRSSAAPSVLAQELSLEAVSGDDNGAIQSWCAEAIEALPEEANAVRRGNPRVLNKLVGKVMQLSRGRADAQNARVVLETMLRRQAH
jgi:aspartyl-tRNA(Asn)/glutamyl-tRNA(Gln) amidotransferase subunit B